MAQYMVVHSLKVSAEQFSQAMEDPSMPEFAKAMHAGETPAKCMKSWNPIPHGNTDTFICLWEANNEEDIAANCGYLFGICFSDFKIISESCPSLDVNIITLELGPP